MAIEIPDSATFAIRSALNRALMENQKIIRDLRKEIENDTVPEFYKDTVPGVIRLQEQWRREVCEEFAKLPEKLRPDADLLDYEVS